MIFFKKGTGLLEDLRHQSLKDLDYKHEEVASASAPTWLNKQTYRKYPIKDQSNSSSCVANATALVLGIENELEEGEYVDLSARDIYSQRLNRPEEGMYFWDALDIAHKNGATLETLMDSNGRGEVKMNENIDRKMSDKQIAGIFKAGGYIELPKDIDSIASILEKGKGVLLGFKFTYAEWGKIPSISDVTPNLHHGVAGVDFTLYNGKKALIIQDSWGLHSSTINGQRIITEDFLPRCTYAGYLLDLSNSVRDIDRPIFDGSIKSLQKVLTYEGFFPNTITPTGVFGSITKKALIEFQKKYGISPAEGVLGPITTKKLLELYK